MGISKGKEDGLYYYGKQQNRNTKVICLGCIKIKSERLETKVKLRVL